jgi:hypothetical protein
MGHKAFEFFEFVTEDPKRMANMSRSKNLPLKVVSLTNITQNCINKPYLQRLRSTRKSRIVSPCKLQPI